jgi:hypothetical protein
MLLIILVVCYFIPTFVAFSRKRHNERAICALNVFLGWTMWVGHGSRLGAH